MANKNRTVVQGKIKNGWIYFSSFFKEALKEFCSTREGKLIYIDINVGNIRSIAQNKFYWGPLIGAFVRATGETNTIYWHEYLKKMFLKKFMTNSKGGILEYIGSTTDLTVGGFAEYLENCKNHLYDHFQGYLTDDERKEYVGTLSKKRRE